MVEPTLLPKNKASLSYRRIYEIMQEKKTASYVTLTLVFATLAIFGIFAIRPTLLTALSLIKNVDELKTLYEGYESKIGDIIRGQAEYEKIRQSIQIIDSALPSTSSFDLLAQGLERIAKKNNINLSQVQIDPVPISSSPFTGTLKQYNFTVSATGTYLNFVSYLDNLLTWNRIITVKGINMEKDESTTSGTLRITLKGTTYYEP